MRAVRYLLIILYLLIAIPSYSFKLEVSDPILRPFWLYISSFDGTEGKNFYGNVYNNFKILPNFVIVQDKAGADFEISMHVQGNIFIAEILNIKTGQTFTLKLNSYDTDIIANSNLLADKIYEKITQTKGIFSTLIAFSMNWNGVRQIFITDFNGKRIKKLTNNKKDSIAPKVSLDKKYIIYTQYLQSSGTALRMINLDNFEDKLMFSSKEINLAGGFDKNNASFYFVSFDGKRSKVYEFFIKEHKAKELYSSRSRIVSPVTTFKENEIAFVSDEYGTPQIFLFNKAEKKIKKISSTPNYATSPHFTVYGDYYAYVGQTNGKGNIYITSVDGSDFVMLTHGDLNYEDPVWLENTRFLLTISAFDNYSQVFLIDIPTQQHRKLIKIPAKISYFSAN